MYSVPVLTRWTRYCICTVPTLIKLFSSEESYLALCIDVFVVVSNAVCVHQQCVFYLAILQTIRYAYFDATPAKNDV